MTARSKSSSVFRHRPQEARAETESSKPRKIVQGSVERTIAWLNRCRRRAKDWENLNCKALAFLRLASIRLMLRRLCNPAGCSRTDSQAQGYRSAARKGLCMGPGDFTLLSV